MGQLKETISQFWNTIQGNLFPWLEEELPPLTEKQQQLVTVLEMIRIEQFIPSFCPGFRGRPEMNRKAIARAFVAKAVYNFPTTTILIERLHSDISLRRICGWEKRSDIPSESVFNRVFADFSNSELPQRVHEELIKKFYSKEIIGHVITDASAIEGREKPIKKEQKSKEVAPKMGRPKKGEEKPKQGLKSNYQESFL